MVDPKMYEMVSDRSSRAENWTDLRKISMRVFFNSKNCAKMIIWSKQIQNFADGANSNHAEFRLQLKGVVFLIFLRFCLSILRTFI